MGGVSSPRVEPSCLGIACINDETGAEIGDDTEDASVAVEAPTTGSTLGGKMLERWRC